MNREKEREGERIKYNHFVTTYKEIKSVELRGEVLSRT